MCLRFPCRLSEHRLKRLSSIFSNLKAQKLLDIGCSDGAIGAILSKSMKTRRVIGLDASWSALVEAARRGLTPVHCDFERAALPLRNESFDVVYCGEVIEHLFNPSHLLEEIMRVLRPGGKCVLTTPNLASWSNRVLLVLGYQPFLTNADWEFGNVGKVRKFRMSQELGEHIQVFTHRALRELIETHGFNIEGVDGASMSFREPFSSSLIGKLLDILGRVLSFRASWSTLQIFLIGKPGNPSHVHDQIKPRHVLSHSSE